MPFTALPRQDPSAESFGSHVRGEARSVEAYDAVLAAQPVTMGVAKVMRTPARAARG